MLDNRPELKGKTEFHGMKVCKVVKYLGVNFGASPNATKDLVLKQVNKNVGIISRKLKRIESGLVRRVLAHAYSRSIM